MIKNSKGSDIIKKIIRVIIVLISLGALLSGDIIPGILLLLLGLFLIFRNKKKSTPAYIPDDAYPKTMQDTGYPAGELYNEAESLRKANHANEAINRYWESIQAGEKDSNWIKFGPAPAMYRELAKLYYHTGQDKKALEVLDRYIELNGKYGSKNTEMKMLRERMEKGNFKRLTKKYS
ncbi:MAG: hypothetical protein MI740_10045 [Halanaerobiales bacterium]|nr:hypothetical protein [Halanaerobiales bacterium]